MAEARPNKRQEYISVGSEGRVTVLKYVLRKMLGLYVCSMQCNLYKIIICRLKNFRSRLKKMAQFVWQI